ncbi:uncharacterized protein LOC128228954 [Mya arenaria]|uniref:uncharacterized protein LOC128228954 n=1 Tax=Mya arenaria TaxID=6604 RepID=UPI0022E1A614|nr:uncharacterized protein LOC128228954 [Mya arenaria]
MFKAIVLTICFYGVLKAIPAPGHGALAGYCDTSSQCDADETCVSFNQPRGRRVVPDTIDPDLMQYVHGSCKKRGTQGSQCIVNEISTGFKGLYYDPLCADGFVCVSTGQYVIPKGDLGTCQALTLAKSATLDQPCATGADCSDTECCVSDMRPIGKRAAHGHCRNMGTSGSGCLVRYPSGKPMDAVFQCPCIASLTCHGTGMHDIPLGEIGKCGL